MTTVTPLKGLRIIPLAQRTKEWHDWRNGVDLPDKKPRITATTAAIVAGDSVTGQTPHQLWMELTGRKERKEPSAFVAARLLGHGERTEDLARAAYVEYTGNVVQDACIEHPDHPWAAASLDGITVPSADIIAEIKCPVSQKVHNVAKSGNVPSYYYPQVQWQLFCAPSVVELHYWSYYEDDEEGIKGALVVVQRDEAYQAKLLADCAEFRTCLVEDRPPASDEWLIAARLYREAKLEVDEATARVQTALDRLIELMPVDKDSFDGGGVKLSRYWTKGVVDYSALLAELVPDATQRTELMERCREPGAVNYSKALAALGTAKETITELEAKHRSQGELRHRPTLVKEYVVVPAEPVKEPAATAAIPATASDVPAVGDWTW